MNNKYIKGEPGYLRHHKLMYGLISLIGFVSIIIIFTVTYIIFLTPRNYFNIGSVLILLPTVKFFVQYSMLPWKCKADPDIYNELKKTMGVLPMHCELLMTGSEKRFEILYLAIGANDEIYVFTENLKTDTAAYSKAVVNFLNYYNYDAKVKVFFDLTKYQNAVAELASTYSEISEEQLAHANTVFEKLSIMCI